MRLLILAEARRLLADRVFRGSALLAAAVLAASAVASGLAARELRQSQQAEARQWAQRLDTAAASIDRAASPEAARMATFQFARSAAPLAVLSPLGGLALGTSAHGALAPDARVTVESRHVDHRKSEPLGNPLLAELGVPDFATTVALLLPLAILVTCAGLLGQARESGTWRLTVAHARSPGAVLPIALGLRGAAWFLLAGAASCLAFALDPGATARALAAWLVALLGFCAGWTALSGLVGLLRLPPASAVLGAIGLWLFSTFCVPALIEARLDARTPVPSRLALVAELRAAQQHAEVHADELVARWYAEHPDTVPIGRSDHTWPVTFMPRFIEQERLSRPLVRRFDRLRAQRSREAAGWLWASPALALQSTAQDLAGFGPARLDRHFDAVDRFEDRWRAFFVPRIMAYRALTKEDLQSLPAFVPTTDAGEGAGSGPWGLLAGGGALAWLAVALRRRAEAP